MKRLIAAALLFASPAFGATYWVSPTGTSGATGADSSANAKSLAWVNSNATAGDIIRFKSGVYADQIRPQNNGTSGNRLRFYGFPQDRGAVRVAGLRLGAQGGFNHGNYTTVRWVTTTGQADGIAQESNLKVTADSIVACNFPAQTGAFEIEGDQCVYDSLNLTGTYTGAAQAVQMQGEIIKPTCTPQPCTPDPPYWGLGLINNTMKNCTFTATVNTASDFQFFKTQCAAYNDFSNNAFNITATQGGGYFFWLESYHTSYSSWTGNTINMTLSGINQGREHSVLSHRDSSSHNRYSGNTFTITGASAISFNLTNPGSYPATCRQNYYGNNNIRVDNPQAGKGILYWQNGCRADTVQFNTIRTSSAETSLRINTSQQDSAFLVRHNTFVNSGPTHVDLLNTTTQGSPKFVSNIFYSTTACGAGTEMVKVPAGVGLDSSGVYFARNGFRTSAISVNGSGGAPGSGGLYGLSGRAIWGSPTFVDSAYSTFSPALGASSYARTATLQDGYAGSWDPGFAGDVTPPGQINDLSGAALSATRALLTWTQAGDDGFSPPNVAIANIRRASSQITNQTAWDNATLVGSIVSGSLSSPGEQQSYTDNTVSASTTYWYAVRCDDNAGNSGALGNSISVTTPAAGGDVTAPTAIGDLAATAMGGDGRSVYLTWTATGNDAGSGTAESYDIRYRAGNTMTDPAQWSAATQVSGEPTPAAAGNFQYMVIGGLANGTQYAFAIKATDASGNTSTISNVAVVTTNTPPPPLATTITRKKKLSRAVF